MPTCSRCRLWWDDDDMMWTNADGDEVHEEDIISESCPTCDENDEIEGEA